MSWTHALTRQTDPKTGEVEYAIREIYFHDDDGIEGPGTSSTTRPAAPVGETVTELQDEIRRFTKAAENPRLYDVDTHEWVPVPATTEENE